MSVPAPRDARQEQAHERPPRDPPGPEEDGPGVQPVFGTVVGIGLERQRHEARQVIASIGHQRVQQEGGLTGEQHEQHHRQRQQHVELRQPPDAPLHARGRRDRREHDDDGGQRGLRPHGFGNAEHVVEAEIELDDPDPQARGDPEHGAQHRGDVHHVADRSVNALAENGKERRPDRQRQAVAEAEEGQRHPHQRVDAPARQPPVQEGVLKRAARVLDALAAGAGGLEELGHRFGDAEEQKVDADPRREQHRRPGQRAEFRP
jgi:hypothetical protein